MKKVKYFTLGCKLNHAETAQVKNLWESAGFAESGIGDEKNPDVIFVNGCAVTQQAEAKTRHAISRLSRLYPQAVVIAGGCAGKADADRIAQIPGVVAVINPEERFQTGWLEKLKEFSDQPIREVMGANEFGAFSNGLRSRPFLKIQDGCDHYCTYCIIPHLRGECRSIPLSEAVRHAEDLVQAGFAEFVLTGIRIGSWGLDFPDQQNLTDLLDKMLAIPRLGRIRLGSIEPWELTPRLIEMVVEHPQLCSHLHVPLQHTHPVILERMGRDSVESAMNAMQLAKAANAEIGLGTDIIVGFPGETEKHFRQLCEVLISLPLTNIHAFSFSGRPGTPAAEMLDQVPSNEKKSRVNCINRIGQNKKREFLSSQIGKTLDVIPDKSKPGARMVSCIAENYAKVQIPSELAMSGKLMRVRVLGIDDKSLYGLPEEKVSNLR